MIHPISSTIYLNRGTVVPDRVLNRFQILNDKVRNSFCNINKTFLTMPDSSTFLREIKAEELYEFEREDE